MKRQRSNSLKSVKVARQKPYAPKSAVSKSNVELKNFDTAISTPIDSTPEILPNGSGQINLIPQDLTATGRVGRIVNIKSIDVQGVLQYIPTTSAVGNTTIMLALVWDKQANGAAASVSDVYSGITSASFNRTLVNEQRFKVLKTWKVDLNCSAGATTAYCPVRKSIERFYMKCNIPIEFSGATGAISEIKSNNLFILGSTAGDSANLEDDKTTFTGTTRVRFSDL